MASENIKYLIQKQGASLSMAEASKPTINKPSEVVIRLKAIAINPADVKMIDQGHRGTSWPLVPGLDGAGIVEAIGDEVDNVAVGDEVLAQFVPGDRGGSYQTLAVIPSTNIAKKPPTWTFEEAASLGVCYVTAMVSLGIGLKTPLTFLKDGPKNGFNPSSVLVLGGSSALGAAAIQLLRLAVPSCIILTTSSPKHHSHITNDLGADIALDRSSSTLIKEIRNSSPGTRGVDAILDVVGAGSSQGDIFEALNPGGPKKYAQVWTGHDETQVPKGVESVLFRTRQLHELPGNNNIMLALQTLLEEGKYKLPLPIHNVGHGVEGLEEGLRLMRRGVSGQKLVATV